MERSGTTSSLRGVHAAGGGVVWASGSHGTVLRTEDSGYMWQTCAMPPGAEKLDFRAIWAWDANTAIVMSSGTGADSRLYKTTDGCSHWILLYTNPDKDGFWDALQFTTRDQGTLLGDPVTSRFVILLTHDGGVHWSQDVSADLGIGASRLGAFAASNSSLVQDANLPGRGRSFGTGGKDGPTFFSYSNDCVQMLAQASPSFCDKAASSRYQKVKLPLASGSDSAGIFSVATHELQGSRGLPSNLRAGSVMIAVGGDYAKPREREGTAAYSEDGGATWALSSVPPSGYRSAVAWDAADNLWITVGPSGSDLSRDDGHTWQAIEYAPDDLSHGGEWNALSLPWAVGPNGRIARLNAEALPHARPRPPAGTRPIPGPPAR